MTPAAIRSRWTHPGTVAGNSSTRGAPGAAEASRISHPSPRAVRLFMTAPFRARERRQVRSRSPLCHHHGALHVRVECADVWVGARVGEGVGEGPRLHHLAGEAVTNDGMLSSNTQVTVVPASTVSRSWSNAMPLTRMVGSADTAPGSTGSGEAEGTGELQAASAAMGKPWRGPLEE